MEKHEYERLIATIKSLENITDWRTYFGDKVTKINNKEKKIVDIVEQILAANSYDDLSNDYKLYDEWVYDINKGVSNMQQITKFYGGKINSDNTIERLPDANAARNDEKELDQNFFGRIAKEFKTSRKDSWKNSSKFGNMEKDLEKVNALINGSSDMSDDERDMKLYDALNALEKSTNAYLEHKVKHGVNANAVSKVESATSMKEYIRERRGEILRRHLETRTKYALYHHGEDPKYTVHEIKQAEIRATEEFFTTLAKKSNISDEKMRDMHKIFENANDMMYYASLNFDYSNDVDPAAFSAAFLTSEFMRNELLVGGGTITPMMKMFLEEPESFRRTMGNTRIVTSILTDRDSKFDKENVDKYASRGASANVAESYAQSIKGASILYSDRLFNSTFATSTTMIQEEKQALERKKAEEAAEKAEKERVRLAELKNQEKAKAIRDKHNENVRLARSYAGLAKFAKDHHLTGPEWDKRIEECTKLAKEYQEKAMFGDYSKKEALEKKTENFRSKNNSLGIAL